MLSVAMLALYAFRLLSLVGLAPENRCLTLGQIAEQVEAHCGGPAVAVAQRPLNPQSNMTADLPYERCGLLLATGLVG